VINSSDQVQALTRADVSWHQQAAAGASGRHNMIYALPPPPTLDENFT